MTEAEKPKKRPPRSVSLSLPSFSFPPSLPLLTALPDINAPYGALWTDFLKLVLAWHTINKTSRRTLTCTPTVHISEHTLAQRLEHTPLLVHIQYVLNTK